MCECNACAHNLEQPFGPMQVPGIGPGASQMYHKAYLQHLEKREIYRSRKKVEKR